MNKLIIFSALIVFALSGCKGTVTDSEFDISTQPIRTPVWVYQSLTQPVPSWGSATRLQLPVQVNQILLGSVGIGGFGAHQGGHVEGLDHVWIEVITGIPIRSWASGTVSKIETMGSELFITIQYDGGLTGKHMEVASSLVAVGQHVNAGDPICYGISNGMWQSAEFMLNDANRNDGEVAGPMGSYVSPFDYLREDIKQSLIAAFNEKVVTPYYLKGLSAGNNSIYEPYLTNQVLFHKNFKGTLAGEWILTSSKWATGGAPDILIFQDIYNEYITYKRVVAADDSGEGQLAFDGTWTADTTAHKFTISSHGTVYYGIYEINETGGRATLKMEYSTAGYPLNFSPTHFVYRERANIPRRKDAESLGVY